VAGESRSAAPDAARWGAELARRLCDDAFAPIAVIPVEPPNPIYARAKYRGKTWMLLFAF